MKKVLVLYYSRSGNTEKMAKAVAEGAQSVSDTTVEVSYHIEPPELSNYDAILFGAPTYRKEYPIDFKNLFEEASAKGISLKGKIGAVFGSYGWSGEAPQQVLDVLQSKFEMKTSEPPLLAKYIPDEAALEASRNLGKKVAETLKNQP
jgi:flavorubredoxin